MGFNFGDKPATILDNGTAIFSATNMHTVALSIIKSLDKPELSRNQYLYVSDIQTSQRQILDAAEKITGEKWNITLVSSQDHIANERAMAQKDGYYGVQNLIQGVTFGTEEQLGDLTPKGLWNEKLGLPRDDLETTLRAAFEGRHAHEV
jgi:hypothetical protein